MSVIPFRPYRPDSRNGEVYATSSYLTQYIDGVEIETPDGFIVVHMSRSGDSAAIFRGYESIEEAEAAASRIARERKAVLA
jgi:hypothetical protein